MDSLDGRRALVTGASGGIGAAIARELAKAGAKLVLTARRKQALEAIAAELGTAEIIVADLGTRGGAESLWSRARAGGPIDILVNNAGFGYFRRFDEVDWERNAELLQLNVMALVELSRRFVADRQGASGRGYLLNVASTAGYQSVPNFAVYAASKAFVRNFTEGLHDELRGSELSATCICPGGTTTDFHAQAGAGDYGRLANFSMLGAETVASIAVRAMAKRRRTVIPGVLNKLSCWGIRLVPRRVASWFATRIMGKPRAHALPSRTSAA